MSVKNVYMVVLMQHDLPAAVEFYKTLGLQLKFHLKDQWAELLLNNVRIGLCPTKQELPDRRPGIVFQIDNIETFFKKHETSLKFISKPQEKVHGIMVSLKDPGNNIIDLYQPTPDKVKDLIKKTKEKGNTEQTNPAQETNKSTMASDS